MHFFQSKAINGTRMFDLLEKTILLRHVFMTIFANWTVIRSNYIGCTSINNNCNSLRQYPVVKIYLLLSIVKILRLCTFEKHL